MNRRAFLALAGAAGLPGGAPATPPDPRRELAGYLAGDLQALAAEWDARRARIRTAAQLEARNRFVRAKVREMLGRAIARCPLEAEVLAVLRRNGYHVENLAFQSRPGLWVTANLYVPAGAGPFPAVISPCGHYELARMHPDYQRAYQALVRSGFVVLAYDPPGQGEREEFPELRSVDEHSLAAHLLLLLGENLAGYFVNDGMRAIDYLLTRREVDGRRIGCAGHSGGGTMTILLACADERIRCAAINEGGTMHRWPVAFSRQGSAPLSEGEQNLFPAAIHGIDACDLHVAVAPRPLLATIERYAPRFNETVDHIRARYRLLGAEQRFAVEEARDRHAWNARLRLATVNWFRRWFYSAEALEEESEGRPEAPALLHFTPQGSLRAAGRGKSFFEMIRDGATPPRPDLDRVRRRVRALFSPANSSDPPAVKRLAARPASGLSIETLEITPERGVRLDARLFLPERPEARPVLWVDDAGAWDQCEAAARRGAPVLALNVRGVGAASPGPARPFAHLFDAETACAHMAWYMDRCLFRMRVFDVRRGLDYLTARLQAPGRGVRITGRGHGAVWALFAASIDRRAAEVVCIGGPVSYRNILESGPHAHSGALFPRGILREMDLPEVAATIAPRPLALVALVDAMKRRSERAEIERAYAWTREVYRAAGAGGLFRILLELESAK